MLRQVWQSSAKAIRHGWTSFASSKSMGYTNLEEFQRDLKSRNINLPDHEAQAILDGAGRKATSSFADRKGETARKVNELYSDAPAFLRILIAGSVIPLLIVLIWALLGAESRSWLLLPWQMLQYFHSDKFLLLPAPTPTGNTEMMVHAINGFVLWWGWLHFSLSWSWSNVMKERLQQGAMSFIAENRSRFAHADDLTESANISCACYWIPKQAETILTANFGAGTQMKLLQELRHARVGTLFFYVVVNLFVLALIAGMAPLVGIAAVGIAAIWGIVAIWHAFSEGVFVNLQLLRNGILGLIAGSGMLYGLFGGVQWGIAHAPMLVMLWPAGLVVVMVLLGTWGERSLGYGSYLLSDEEVRNAVYQAGSSR